MLRDLPLLTNKTGDDMTKKMIRIGNAGGYWGDDLSAFERQIKGGPIDYITMDFLAEITMSIMQKQKERDPSSGYARDFLDQIRSLLPIIHETGVKIITNAGGVNPRGCADAIRQIAKEQGISINIGVVEGDGLMDKIDEIRKSGVSLEDMETGASFDKVADRLMSANAYFGAVPVAKALEEGAQIIVTGRVTDTGITLAPMIHEFGWAMTEYDKLGAGIIAGHIIECGCQSTGGNFTDWETVPSFDHIGYPIVEVNADGSFVVTKHEGTGGLVNVKTVKEQLVYEMGDPVHYLTPDVVADFTAVMLKEDGPNRVRVSGGRGTPPTAFLKVSISYRAGYKASGAVIISGPNALAKAKKFAEIFWSRYATETEDRLTEYIGHNSCHRNISRSSNPEEIYLRLGVRDEDRTKVREFSKLLPSIILSGPPGVSAVGGRPPVQDVVAYWPALIPRDLAEADVSVISENGERQFHVKWEGETSIPTDFENTRGGSGRFKGDGGEGRTMVTVPLSRICHGRSGDKGDTVNVGLIARHPDLYPLLVREMTPGRVKSYFGEFCNGVSFRYEVPNLHAINFLLSQSLGGGGTLALQIDPQGKTLAHALMRMEIEVDERLLALVPESGIHAGGASRE